MSKFTVTVTRSAVEVADLSVEADTQEAAEQRIEEALDTTTRVGLDDLAKMKGVSVLNTDAYGDDESSWEVG